MDDSRYCTHYRHPVTEPEPDYYCGECFHAGHNGTRCATCPCMANKAGSQKMLFRWALLTSIATVVVWVFALRSGNEDYFMTAGELMVLSIALWMAATSILRSNDPTDWRSQNPRNL